MSCEKGGEQDRRLEPHKLNGFLEGCNSRSNSYHNEKEGLEAVNSCRANLGGGTQGVTACQ